MHLLSKGFPDLTSQSPSSDHLREELWGPAHLSAGQHLLVPEAQPQGQPGDQEEPPCPYSVFRVPGLTADTLRASLFPCSSGSS